jgi:hypothetical protein
VDDQYRGRRLVVLFSRDGLIIAYVLSIVAGLIASLVPLFRSYGVPHGWKPHPDRAWQMARRNVPLAAADAIEWGSRRLDVAILGLFVSPAFVGVYYVAQQVASLPQRLKTSFDPILAPVLTDRLAAGDNEAVAKQVRQVGFWIIAAQMGIALALGWPGGALMGLVGTAFVGGAFALAFLLLAEVVAAPQPAAEAATTSASSRKARAKAPPTKAVPTRPISAPPGQPSASAMPICAAMIQKPTCRTCLATASLSPAASRLVRTGARIGSKLVLRRCGSEATCCAT